MNGIHTDDAQSTKASRKSDARLKISPDKLPKVPYSRPKVLSVLEMPRECAIQVSDYFRKIHEKRKAAYFSLRGGKSR